ncbi:MAG: hypothetical protein QME51_07950 [Planctomycetota bacterium]|nr:hypothetical protein [Planctomycetota bacterium]MDI6788289.1 hypothetical protein [Planctomycetota bacterium]
MIKIIRQKDNPLVSVIIPSLDGYRGGNVPKLIEALNNQTFQDFELLVVTGEKPCARAHNVGVQSAKGEIIVFFDDDITLGNEKVIENLISPLRTTEHRTPNTEHRPIGITGASTLLPPDANRFQRRCAKEFTRFEFSIVREITETDMATHVAMAIKKDVYIKVGQENENLIFGDDPDLRHRVRQAPLEALYPISPEMDNRCFNRRFPSLLTGQAGYKIVVVPSTWIYHPPPHNLSVFLRMSFQRGIGAAHDFWHYPHLIYETPPADTKTFVPQRPFLYRVVRFIIHNLDALINIKLIFVSVRIAYGLGYIMGMVKQFVNPDMYRGGDVEKG